MCAWLRCGKVPGLERVSKDGECGYNGLGNCRILGKCEEGEG